MQKVVNIQNYECREILLGADEEQIRFLNECELFRMKGMDAYIAIRGSLHLTPGMCYEDARPRNFVFLPTCWLLRIS